MASEPTSFVKTPDVILVTGGAGFIGSHLCETLLDQGDKVICLDNFCDFYDPELKESNITDCLKHENFTLERGDIRDSDVLTAIFAAHRIDCVVHLAAMAGVRPSIADPALYTDVNVTGTLSVLRACQEHKVTRLVFASSSSVYGNRNDLPFSESDNVDRPVSPYAATKIAGEMLCHTWHHLYAMSVICLRFFTVYGPRQRPDLAIRKFMDLAMSNSEIPVFGNGGSSRDYTFVTDIIQGTTAAIELTAQKRCYEVINLGNDHAIPLHEMIDQIRLISGREIVTVDQPYQDGDVMHTCANISKAVAMLGYSPQISFSQGMRLFGEWHKSHWAHLDNPTTETES